MTRHTTRLLIATVTTLLLAAAPAAAAKLEVYSAEFPPILMPTVAEEWTEGDTVIIPPGATRYLGFVNQQDGDDQSSKYLRVDLLAAPGSNANQLQLHQPFGWRQEYIEPNFPVEVRGLEERPVGNDLFLEFTFWGCPLWEQIVFTNPTGNAIQFTVNAMSWCTREAPPQLDAFHIDTTSFGVQGAMDGTLHITELEIYPIVSAVDQGQAPGVCVPQGTGNWSTQWSFQDPNGDPRPGGGFRMSTDGLGIAPGEKIGLDFGLLGPESAYRVFAYNDDDDEWFEFLQDYRAPYFDTFDPQIYQPGQGLNGHRAWRGYDGNPAADAIVAPNQFLSPPFSVDVQGNANPIREFGGAADSGQWFFQTWTYVPGNFQSPDDADPYSGSHIRLYNTYVDGGPNHWSVDLQFDSRDENLKVFVGNGPDTIDVPYIVDQWVPIDVVVDLENDWTEVFYDQQPLVQFQWTAGFDGSGGGAPAIAAVDLFAGSSSSIFYDDMVLAPLGPPCPFDLDKSGDVGFSDVLKVIAAWGTCGCCAEDVDASGDVGFADVLALIGQWGPCPQ